MNDSEAGISLASDVQACHSMSTDKKSTETNNACETGMGTAVASFLLGATAGVAAGIMLAPRAAELAGEVKASTSDMARRGVQAVDGVVDAGAMEAHGAIDCTVAAVQVGSKKGHEVVNDTANALHMAGAALRDRASRRKRGWRCASAFWGTGIRAI